MSLIPSDPGRNMFRWNMCGTHTHTQPPCVHSFRGSVGAGPTGVPRSYKNALPWDPTVGLCLGPYGGPKDGDFSYERGSPVKPWGPTVGLYLGAKDHPKGGERDREEQRDRERESS